MGGSHTLEKFINEVARDVPDPQTKMSVWQRARSYEYVNGSANARKELDARPDLRIDPLGSGSDYTPFLQHLGIATLNIGFGGESGGGSYHSIYDSFDHYTRFGDTDFSYGIALAKTAGRATLRLANADILPFEFTNSADTIATYVDEVARLADTMRTETKMMNQLLADGTYQAVQDPKQNLIAPKPKSEVPLIDFKPLENAVRKLRDSAEDYEKATRDKRIPASAQKSLDAALYQTERALTSQNGLPRRSWFRHQIYAPGFYTGYGVKTLPGVREAIEQRNWQEATAQIAIVAATIERFAGEIDRAAKIARQ
jgi:N-acetylated-alpha-linked acidic dipeptidase